MTEIDFTKWDFLHECPTWWQNFINVSIDEELREGSKQVAIDEILRNILKEYNANFYGPGNTLQTLFFDSEEDFLYFVMRWG